MITFFLILLFGKEVLLTDSPITLTDEWTEITIERKINAITHGASLNIELATSDPILNELKDSIDPFSKLESIIPEGSIESFIIFDKNLQVRLINSSFSISDFTFSKDGSVRIMLTPANKLIPARKNVKSVKIKSNMLLNNVNIIWKNYSK